MEFKETYTSSRDFKNGKIKKTEDTIDFYKIEYKIQE